MTQRTSPGRQYVLLRPVTGQARGFVRMEHLHGRSRTVIRARDVPAVPLRALLLGGDEQTGAVLDLGLMQHGPSGTATLHREGAALPQGYHTIALARDWPHAELLLRGSLQPTPCTLWQMQAAVRHYLRFPAQDSAPAPAGSMPEPPGRSVLLLRRRVST